MKTGINLLLSYALLISTGCSQSIRIERGYGYSREIISGVKPKVTLQENGNVINENKTPGIQYFIFIETRDTVPPPVKNIWISGRNYLANTEAVKELPVIIAADPYGTATNDTLVRDRKLNVWKINVGQLAAASDTTFETPTELNTQAVLIGFFKKGSLQYYSIAALQHLEPIRLQ